MLTPPAQSVPPPGTYQPALIRKDKNYVSTTGLTDALGNL